MMFAPERGRSSTNTQLDVDFWSLSLIALTAELCLRNEPARIANAHDSLSWLLPSSRKRLPEAADAPNATIRVEVENRLPVGNGPIV